MNFLVLAAVLLGADPEPLPAGDPKVQADRLVSEGAALGQAGKWDEAIAAFERADALFPRAIHACNIGLAHARANRPEKALMKLSACQSRATEPLPAWVAKRTIEARAALSKGAFAPLELVSATVGLHITIAHYGETTFTTPVTVWLPLGEHRLVATAPGKRPLDEVVSVASKQALRRVITLEDEPVPDPVKPDPIKPDPIEPDPIKPDPIEPDATKPKPESDLTPAWVTIGVGGAAIVTGGIFYGLALSTRGEAEDLSGSEYDAKISTLETQRALAYGFLIGGAAVTATGIILAYVLDDDDDTVTLMPLIGPETGAVARIRF